MTRYALNDKTPSIHDSAWIAPNAAVIGDVALGDGSSVWWNTVIRGDTDHIAVGERSNIQDGSVLHTDAGIRLQIGRDVTVGHMVMLHGCTVGDNCLIGIGSIVLNRAVIGRNSMVGANTLIPEGKTYPEGVLILGSPGKVVRNLTEEEIARITRSAEHYVANAARYRTTLRQL
ncbi:MAG: gamma carbonic anhydrase family protein [Rhodocyclaceae bacterium]|nr:MAG: gamma carbonic anhydrase family protein [Rhodocyclaceae bacterium]